MRGAVQTHEDSGRVRSRRNPLCPQVLNESGGSSRRLRRVAAFSQFAPATQSEANPSTNDVAEARSVASFFLAKFRKVAEQRNTAKNIVGKPEIAQQPR